MKAVASFALAVLVLPLSACSPSVSEAEIELKTSPLYHRVQARSVRLILLSSCLDYGALDDLRTVADTYKSRNAEPIAFVEANRDKLTEARFAGSGKKMLRAAANGNVSDAEMREIYFPNNLPSTKELIEDMLGGAPSQRRCDEFVQKVSVGEFDMWTTPQDAL